MQCLERALRLHGMFVFVFTSAINFVFPALDMLFFSFHCSLTVSSPLLLLHYIYLNEQLLDRKCPFLNNMAK